MLLITSQCTNIYLNSRPVFRICVLYVDEEISVQRQLARGRMIREHNVEVKKTGQGVFWDERVTDNDENVSYYFVVCVECVSIIFL